LLESVDAREKMSADETALNKLIQDETESKQRLNSLSDEIIAAAKAGNDATGKEHEQNLISRQRISNSPFETKTSSR